VMGRFLLCLALPLLLCSVAGGVPQSSFVPTSGHDMWNVAAGFPGGYVYAITQTGDGYIWIGTSKGLFRYDGLNFAAIRKPDSSADVKVPIFGLVTDLNHQLWAVDDHTHIFSYADGHLTGPLADNGRHLNFTGLVSRNRKGWLLFASELQGVVEYENGLPRVLLDASMMPWQPTAVAEMADGTVWMGTRESGLFGLHMESGKPEFRHFEGLTNVKVNCLLRAGDSTLLIGTDKGLLSLHDGKLTKSHQELGNREILAMTNGRENDTWIGTEGNAFRVRAKDIDDDGVIRALDRVTVDGAVTALFEDRDGDLWIGRPEAVERYREGGFSTYLGSAGLPCSNCGAIHVDRRDRLWFAPWNGGLFQLSQGALRQIEVAGLNNDTVYSIAEGADEEIWLARKSGGVTRLRSDGDGVKATEYKLRSGGTEDAVLSVYRSADGAVWAGTRKSGLSRLRGETWQTFSTRDGLPSNTILAITGNVAEKIFVGTANGLGTLGNEGWKSYTAAQGLPPGPIESLFLDDADILWIGTTKGISFLQVGVIHVPLGAPNALYGEILGIAESDGWLWITTRDHVLRVKSAALLKQTFGEGDYREFGATEGLPSTEGVKRARSVVQDNRGHIWFSLNKGISVLRPLAFATPAYPVSVRVDEMLVDGRPVAPSSQIRIPAGRHRLTFRYAGVNVTNPAGVSHRYRLDGVDSVWSEPTLSREVEYTNIPPGPLEFHVMARNPDGVWDGPEATMSFEIAPEYWQTRWFRMGSVFGFALVAIGLYQLRLRQLHRQFNVGLEERVAERTRIARELHDTLLQSFHGLMFQFQAARNMLPRSPQNAMETLDEAILSTEKAIAESRDAIQDLRPESVAQRDLAQLLTKTGQELTVHGGENEHSPVFRVLVEGESQALSPMLHEEISRIAREVIRNAFHHACASLIEVEIRYDARQFRLRVRDDGKGIDPKVLQNSGRAGHWGLPGIRERAQKIGSRLEFWSEAGVGTEVELTIPAAIAYKNRRESSRFRLFPKAGT
jgi:signal transduction histidine kinase/ligand-binding sensor domain-containing protein